jgi:hypothetical protein
MRSIPFRRLRTLRAPRARPADHLSLTRHYGLMKTNTAQKVLVLVTILLTAGAWTLVLWMGIVVSQLLLDTLSYIVDLAAIT